MRELWYLSFYGTVEQGVRVIRHNAFPCSDLLEPHATARIVLVVASHRSPASLGAWILAKKQAEIALRNVRTCTQKRRD